MKIALVGNSLWEMFIFRKDVILYLKEIGYSVWLIAARSNRERDDFVLSKLKGIAYEELKLARKGINPFKEILVVNNLRKIYLEKEFDIIIHYTIKPNIYGNIAAFFARTKSISVITGLGYVFLNQGLISFIAKKMYFVSLRFSQEIWFLNDDDRKLFIESGLVKKSVTFVMPGEGINLVEFSPLQKKNNAKVVCLMIARLLKDKGVCEYVKAAKIIKEKYHSVTFQLLGQFDNEGNPSAVHESMLNEYFENKIISYLGVVKNVEPIIRDCDCVVLPSYREGMSRVLMEAAAMGKPVITTSVPGCKELVDDELTGFLCNVQDVTSLVEKIDRFINLDREKRLEMGFKGRLKMEEEYNVNRIKEIYKKRIEKLLLC